MKKYRIFKISCIILLLYLVGCKKKVDIVIEDEENNIFTQDFFDGLTEIKNDKLKIIDDVDKLQVICQTLSQLELTEIPYSERISRPIKYGTVGYIFSYSDGSKKGIFLLGTEIGVDVGNEETITYEANQDINDIFREQFKEVE